MEILKRRQQLPPPLSLKIRFVLFLCVFLLKKEKKRKSESALLGHGNNYFSVYWSNSCILTQKNCMWKNQAEKGHGEEGLPIFSISVRVATLGSVQFPVLLTSSLYFWRNTEHPLYIGVLSLIASCCFITIINLWIIVTNSVGLLWWIHFPNIFCCHKCDLKVCQVSSSLLLINIAHDRDSFKTFLTDVILWNTTYNYNYANSIIIGPLCLYFILL